MLQFAGAVREPLTDRLEEVRGSALSASGEGSREHKGRTRLACWKNSKKIHVFGAGDKVKEAGKRMDRTTRAF